MELLQGWYQREPRRARDIPTLFSFAPDYITKHANLENKPSTVEEKVRALDLYLLPFFGRRRLDRIDPEGIAAFKDELLEVGLEKKTINNFLGILSHILSTAHEWDRLSVVPKIKRFKVAEPEFDFLDFREADRLLSGAEPEPEWWTAILVALRTGLRRGEIMALRWTDLDLDAGRLIVRQATTRGKVGTPKSGKPREIPLSRVVVAAVSRHKHLRGKLVFCRDTGKPFKDDHMKYPLRRVCRRAMLREIGWHVLRHTFASHLVMRGVPLKTVQELLGHSDIRMTMRYAHLSPDVKREAVELLDGTPASAKSATRR